MRGIRGCRLNKFMIGKAIEERDISNERHYLIQLYKSKYGATKKYADWLSASTGFSCIETDKADIGMISGYDVVILGGGIYASGIAGLSFFKKNIDKLNDKKLIVFCCGASPFDQDAYEAVVAHNMKGALEGIPCF